MREFLTSVKKWMTFLLSRIATILLSVMTFLVLYQVFTRYVLNSPAAFTEELVRYSLIWTGFIGAAYAFSTREHMSLVLLQESLKPEGRRILMICIDTLILIFAIFIITIGGFKLAMSAQKVYSALLGIPRSLVYAMAPVSGIFIIIAQLINLYEDVTGIKIEGGNESRVLVLQRPSCLRYLQPFFSLAVPFP